MKPKDILKPSAPPMEAGSYLGVCIGVVGLGEQETRWNGKTRYAEKIKFVFEIPEETIQQDGEERPRQLSTELSMAKKESSKIRQFLSGWLGRVLSDDEYMNMEFFELIGRNAILNVVRSEDNQYANIASASPLLKGQKPVQTVSKTLKFDANDWNDEEFEALPEYLKERIKKSTQYKNAHLPDQEVSVEAANQEAVQDADGGEECPF